MRLHVTAVLAALLTAPLAHAQGDGIGWTQYRGNPSRSGFRIWALQQEPVGRFLWRRDVGKMWDSSPVVDASSGVIYVGTEEMLSARSLVAVSPDGTERWSARLPLPLSPTSGMRVRSAPAILSDGSLFVHGYADYEVKDDDGTVTGYRGINQLFRVSKTGQIVASQPAAEGHQLISPLRISDDEIYVLVHGANMGGTFYKYDRNLSRTGRGGSAPPPVTGGASWHDVFCAIFVCFDPSGVPGDAAKYRNRALGPSPAWDSLRNQVVGFGVRGARVAGDGGRTTDLWQKDLTSVTTPVITNGTMLLGTADGYLEARKADGGRLWRTKLPGRPTSPPAVNVNGAQDTFFVTDDQGYLSAVDIEGHLVWKKRIGVACTVGFNPKPCNGDPVVVSIGTKRQIVVTSNNKFVGSYALADGERIWAVPLDSVSRGTPAIVKGRIYLATERYLYAFE